MPGSFQTMPTITRAADGTTRLGVWEPGNGTRYTAIAVPWHDSSQRSWNQLGSVRKGWLVVTGSGRAYLLQEHIVLLPGYVGEKFGYNINDAYFVALLINELLRGPQAPV